MLATYNTVSAKPRLWASMLILATVCLPQVAQAGSQADRPVVAYVDFTGKSVDVDHLPWNDITHVNIAFAGIDMRGNCAWMDTSGNDRPDTSGRMPKAIAGLIAARNKHNPNAKLILSVGGWTMSYRFSDATRTQEGTDRLANTCVAMMNNLGLDGLDYDWEYPTKLGKKNCPQGLDCATNSDPQRFTALLKSSRAALDNTGATGKPLSVAVFMTPGNRGIPYDVAGMDAYLTYWNIMAYDNLAPSWSLSTGFHAAVLDTENSLYAWVAEGATASKLNLGLPYYGYVWYNVPDASIGAKAPSYGDGAQISTPKLLETFSTDAGCKLYNDRNGDYYYCASGTNKGAWAAVETPRVIQDKASFVVNNNFGGLMMWSVNMDGPGTSNILTDTVAKALRQPNGDTNGVTNTVISLINQLLPKH